MWSAEEMPKAKENQQEGENTPRDDRGKSGDLAAGVSSVDAGTDLAKPLGENIFKEGESVICSAKKMKHLYDGQNATIVRVMAKERVKIKMTSGGKKDEVRVVDAHSVRKNETQGEKKARRAAHAQALFDDTT